MKKILPIISLLILATACTTQESYMDGSSNYTDQAGSKYKSNDVASDYNSVNKYDNIAVNKKDSAETIDQVHAKWYTGGVEETMVTEAGHSFVIDTRQNTGELKEFRVRWLSANGKAYPDTIENMIAKVADKYMIQICGKGMPMTIYYRPSLLLTNKEIGEWQIVNNGSQIKEYGFRCLF